VADAPGVTRPAPVAVAGPLPDAGPLEGARRVLVLRLDNLGDVLMTGPALRALRAALPDAELVLLASPGGVAAAELLPWIDRAEAVRVLWQDAHGRLPFDPERELALADRVRALEADAAVILTSFSQTAWPAAYLCYLAGIPVRIGHADDFGGGVLSHPIAGPAPVHQVDRSLHLLEAVGIRPAGSDLEVRLPDAAQAQADALRDRHGIAPGVAVIVLPGASAPARRYPAERFAEAARILAQRTRRPVVVAGTEAERNLVSTVAAGVPGSVALAGEGSVATLAALMARCAVVLANDSLGMHLADALDRPVVATFAGTDLEVEWRPRQAPAVLLREPTACAPCRRFDCPIGQPCLDVPPAAVAAAATVLLAGAPGRLEVPCAG
jgi:ADP-heptose:LPS heptosyltransferase